MQFRDLPSKNHCIQHPVSSDGSCMKTMREKTPNHTSYNHGNLLREPTCLLDLSDKHILLVKREISLPLFIYWSGLLGGDVPFSTHSKSKQITSHWKSNSEVWLETSPTWHQGLMPCCCLSDKLALAFPLKIHPTVWHPLCKSGGKKK